MVAGGRSVGSVAVFCGSRDGHDPAAGLAAHALGEGLALARRRLVYGGGRVGLMGAVADAVLGAGGEVVGVIPEFLTQREVVHQGVGEMIVTATMHTRKERMVALSDAFVTLPGGLGTLDETLEVLTWRQLGLHNKPIYILDVDGSARGLLAALRQTVADGFAAADTDALFEVAHAVPDLLRRLCA